MPSVALPTFHLFYNFIHRPHKLSNHPSHILPSPLISSAAAGVSVSVIKFNFNSLPPTHIEYCLSTLLYFLVQFSKSISLVLFYSIGYLCISHTHWGVRQWRQCCYICPGILLLISIFIDFSSFIDLGFMHTWCTMLNNISVRYTY